MIRNLHIDIHVHVPKKIYTNLNIEEYKHFKEIHQKNKQKYHRFVSQIVEQTGLHFRILKFLMSDNNFGEIM